MSENEGKQGFKVADRRRFDSAGNARSGSEDEKAVVEERKKPESAPEKTVTKEAVMQKNDEESAESESNEIDFSSFVMSLATQALMQLGQLPPPQGMQVQVDKVAAKQAIDIISMLEVKTKGNLDAGEKRLIDEVLHSLRMSFVRTA